MDGLFRNMTAWTLAALLLGASSPSFGQAGPQDNWVMEPDLTWGSAGTTNGQFNHPWGIAVDTQFVYVVDSGNHRIQIFTKDGQYTSRWGSVQSSANGAFNTPRGIAMDATNVYVAERLNYRIQVLSKTGAYLRKWGSSGSGAGLFNEPSGLAVDTQYVFVADTGNHRIQVFDKDGTFVRMWGSQGTVAGQFNQPTDVVVDSRYVYVTDLYNSRVQVFDREGVFIRAWTLTDTAPTGGTVENHLGLEVDAHNVYVAMGFLACPQCPSISKLLAYDKYGGLLWQWTNTASVAPLQFPNAVASDGYKLYVADWGANQVIPFTRLFRTLGPPTPDSIPLVDVLSVNQRNGQPIMDVDYLVDDPDDSTVTVYAAAFIVGTNAKPHLADFVPMRTFVDGTGTNAGPGITPGPVRRLSWDMEADQLDNTITNYGNVKVSLLAKDDRGLLDLHFISIPAVGTNTAFEISRDPLYHHDLLPMWFWYLAAGDTNIALSGGQVVGVGGAYNGLTLASGTNTTADGRSFLYGRLNVREANANELQVAREGSTPGSIALWTPRREPPPAGYKVNAFNFVTSPTNGWWVVPLP